MNITDKIDSVLIRLDEDGLDDLVREISKDFLGKQVPEKVRGATVAISYLLCSLTRSTWRYGAEMFAGCYFEFWASMPKQSQASVLVDALRTASPETLEPLIMIIADTSVEHMTEVPEIAAHWLRLCRGSETWTDYCSYAVRVRSGGRARIWLEDNWAEPSIDELTRLLKRYGWARE